MLNKCKIYFGYNESIRSLLQNHCSVWPGSLFSNYAVPIEGKKTNKGNFLQHRHIIIIILIAPLPLQHGLDVFLYMSDF